MIYTLQNLIDEWKLRKGLMPLRTDAAFHRYDSLDIDAALARGIDAWYQNLLDTAPLSMLVVHDIAAEVETLHSEPGLTVVKLPDDCRRVVEVDVAPGSRPAVLVGPDTPLAGRQGSPFSRGGARHPVVIVTPDRLYINGPRLERLLVVNNPPEGFYEMDPSALTTISTVYEKL